MILEQIRHIVRTNTVSAWLENSNDDKWVYKAVISYNNKYRELEFHIPIDKIDDGFSSVMPAKYLLKYLKIK